MFFLKNFNIEKYYGIDIYKLYNIEKENVLYEYGSDGSKGRILEKNGDEIFNKYNHFKNVEIIREFTRDCVSKFEDESIDLVFIGAGHLYSQVYEDIELYLPKVKKGGILAVHDFF